ncbi:MAG: hypothetical protein ABJH45_01110 [Paracoccaceae bacterium]
MPAFDPSHMTKADRLKIEKRARRNVGSEVKLILTAGLALVMILLFWFGNSLFVPLAELFGTRPTVVWIGLGVTISLTFGLIFGWLESRRVAKAREQQFEIHNLDEANKRAETAEKIEAFKKPQAS